MAQDARSKRLMEAIQAFTTAFDDKLLDIVTSNPDALEVRIQPYGTRIAHP